MSVNETPKKAGRAAAVLAAVSLATTVYYALAAIAVHILNPALSPVRNYMSDYALGAYGGLYAAAYLATGVGCLALAAALWLGVAPPARSAGGVALLTLTAAAVFVLAFYPTELLAPGEAPHTARGAVHAIAAFGGFAAFVVAAALVTRGLRADERFGAIRPALVALAWLSAIAFVALLAVVGAKAPIAGLAEKSFLAAREAWLFVVAGALLFSGRRSARGVG